MPAIRDKPRPAIRDNVRTALERSFDDKGVVDEGTVTGGGAAAQSPQGLLLVLTKAI